MSRSDDPEKPPYGSPCNNCGLCCRDRLCLIGERLFEHAPCPAIEVADGAAACGVIAHPRRYSPARAALYGAAAVRKAVLILSGAGLGCDALLTCETRSDEAAHAMWEKAQAAPSLEVVKACKIFGLVDRNSKSR